MPTECCASTRPPLPGGCTARGPLTLAGSGAGPPARHTLADTRLDVLGERYRGKVRDVYRQRDRLFLVATDRLSAFDRVLTTIPFKGEVLNRLARFWFERTEEVVKNHVLDVPDPNVTVARATTPFAVEVVVRGYLTGSLWRDVQKGSHTVYGVDIPRDLPKDGAFPTPILTPSTKAPVGEHDEPVSGRRRCPGHRQRPRLGPHPRGRPGPLQCWPEAWCKTQGLDPGRHQVRVQEGRRHPLRHRRDPHPRQLPLLARGLLRRAARHGAGPGHAGQGRRSGSGSSARRASAAMAPRQSSRGGPASAPRGTLRAYTRLTGETLQLVPGDVAADRAEPPPARLPVAFRRLASPLREAPHRA